MSQCLALAAAMLLVVLAAVPSGCKKDDKSGEQASATTAGGEMVKPSAEGSKYDPPVKKEQIPDGAWMCDMGTVHFAASEKGKGTCDLCGMPLVEKGAAPAADEKAAPAADEKAPAIDAGNAP